VDTNSKKSIEGVWRQKKIPVIYRKGKPPLMVRLPYSENNFDWLRDTKLRRPKWNIEYKCWETPLSWLNDIVTRTLNLYNHIYIIQPYQPQEKCAPACWNAKGHICQCACMGEHHGSQNPDGHWFIVSETFATRWREKVLACRLLVRKDELKDMYF